MRKLSYTLFILWVSFVCPSCHNLGKTDSQTLPTELFSDGDLAFRRGTGFMSRIVVAADKNGTYSHVGILKKMQGEWHVIHAVPGEPEFKGDPDRVKIEPLTRFFTPDTAVRCITGGFCSRQPCARGGLRRIVLSCEPSIAYFTTKNNYKFIEK